MRKTLLLLIGFLITSLMMSQTLEPELVSSSGDSYSNSNFQLDWSIGECVTATLSSGDNILTQGFHQNSYVITAIEDLFPDIVISLYPNPTNDFVNLKTEISKIGSFQYAITDLKGILIEQKRILSTIQTLDFKSYSAGVYFLSVTENNQLIKSFRIIKK